MITRPALVGLLLAIAAGPALAHEGAIEVRSTAPGGGQLVATNVPDERVPAPLIYCAGGDCLYVSEEGAIMTPADDDPAAGLYALADGTTVRFQIQSIDPGASVKIASSKLDRVGESANLGKAQGLHAHFFWQIETPQGEIGDWRIVFRLMTGAAGYSASEDIEVVVTNDEGATTTTSITTSTSLGSATCGNGVAESGESCDAGGAPWSAGRACDDSCSWIECGDPDGDGQISASDALFTLAAAVATQFCDVCVCNVDASAPSGVAGADALRILRHAIGVDTTPLACPTCAS